MSKQLTQSTKPRYKEHLEALKQFLSLYEDPSIEQDEVHGQYYYKIQLQKISNRDSTLLEIFIEDLQVYFQATTDADIIDGVYNNTKHYQQLLLEAADSVMPALQVQGAELPQDVLNQHRKNNASGAVDQQNSELFRRYEIVLRHRNINKIELVPLRQVGSKHIGKLITVKGIVTRASDVQPLMQVATYLCDVCGYEGSQTVSLGSFQPLSVCSSEQCRQHNSKGKLHFQTRGSKFVDYQELKVQEPSDQVPMGQVPRTITIKAFGEMTNKCTPGDQATFTGVFLPFIYTGYRSLRAGLLHDTYIEAFCIQREKKSYAETTLSNDMVERIHHERTTADIYTRLAQSIAPEIYGMMDVKKALLLLLVGGATKEMEDGVKIRGDINVLLMGDPGVAKSQLLKHIARLTPRGIYTTGKGSSGVGLTAAMLKDPISGELVLEGGALVLADMGICCIDEFDKMDEKDRTAIHEVMEQQTVSIAKAGITTSLKARTSILAAANPLYGRYNPNKTPHENINLPHALLSRFDLVFLLLDTAEPTNDILLAQHVTYVHMHGTHPQMIFEPLDSAFMRAYIAEAKRINPYIPGPLQRYICDKYVEKRKEQMEVQKEGFVYVTPRTLLGIIRLAQGLARLRFGDVVEQDDVDEALRLMEACRSSVNDINKKKYVKRPMEEVWDLIKEELKIRRSGTADLTAIEQKIEQKGYSVDLIRSVIDRYESLNVISVSNDRRKVTLIETS